MNSQHQFTSIALLLVTLLAACSQKQDDSHIKRDLIPQTEAKNVNQLIETDTDSIENRSQPSDTLNSQVTAKHSDTGINEYRQPLRGQKQYTQTEAGSPAPQLPEKNAATQMIVRPGFPGHNSHPQRVRKQRHLNHKQIPVERENYAHFNDNPLKLAMESPVSTFSVDVDTGSYANVRRILKDGHLPRHDAVRIEELINYFNYNYALPDTREQPFSITTELAPTPWNRNSILMHVGLKAFEKQTSEIPASNLVFLIDVSGSMRSRNKLPLLKNSLKLLVQKMRKQDRISIVVYAGASGVVLQPTPGNEKHNIQAALNQLEAGGSTNGGAGIRLAYDIAQSAFIKNGINRILLCTDGDFNVGTTNFNALTELVTEKRKSGIALSTIGFGRGNLNDHLAEQLANKGNGTYSYIDSLQEAQKILTQEMSGSLFTVARDVKIQLEFNPATVHSYRLIGYVNRKLAREDFNNDKVDAGDIGAGHTVTALYEITPVNSQTKLIEPLRYRRSADIDNSKDELLFVKLRYKAPDEDKSQLISYAVTQDMLQENTAELSSRFKFSASVAAFGQRLRGGKHLGNFSWQAILDLARSGRGNDNNGYRGEFIQLVNLAKNLDTGNSLATLDQ